jgi:hypothetical protein
MDFEQLLTALAGLIGSEVYVEVRAPGDVEVMTMRGHLAAADDLGEFERREGVGSAEHDRLLFQLREHPYPEGFFLDRSLIESAQRVSDEVEPGIRIALRDGYMLHVIEHRGSEESSA